MPDVQEVFRMATTKVGPEPGALDRQRRGQRRRQTQQRIGVLAVVAAIIVAGVLLTMFASTGASRQHDVPVNTPDEAAPEHALTPQTAEIVALNGTVLSTIHGLPDDAFSLSLSSDGSRVAFLTAESGTTEIATMRVDGSGLEILSTPGILPAVPQWSHDGSRIAFSGTNAQLNSDIYVIDASGEHLRRLTSDTGSEYSTSWSPDDSVIAYGGGPKNQTSQVWVVPSRGGPATRLSQGSESGRPAFSPDGASIVYEHSADELWVMGSDGANPHRIASVTPAFTPQWSPNGTMIAYTVFDPSFRGYVIQQGFEQSVGVLSLYVLDLGTGRSTRVGAVAVAGPVNGPRWLPSGDALLVLGVRQA